MLGNVVGVAKLISTPSSALSGTFSLREKAFYIGTVLAKTPSPSGRRCPTGRMRGSKKASINFATATMLCRLGIGPTKALEIIMPSTLENMKLCHAIYDFKYEILNN